MTHWVFQEKWMFLWICNRNICKIVCTNISGLFSLISTGPNFKFGEKNHWNMKLKLITSITAIIVSFEASNSFSHFKNKHAGEFFETHVIAHKLFFVLAGDNLAQCRRFWWLWLWWEVWRRAVQTLPQVSCGLWFAISKFFVSRVQGKSVLRCDCFLFLAECGVALVRVTTTPESPLTPEAPQPWEPPPPPDMTWSSDGCYVATWYDGAGPRPLRWRSVLAVLSFQFSTLFASFQRCGSGLGAGLKCQPCPAETYNHDPDKRQCLPCTNCTLFKRKFRFLCRPQVNAECGPCEEG